MSNDALTEIVPSFSLLAISKNGDGNMMIKWGSPDKVQHHVDVNQMKNKNNFEFAYSPFYKSYEVIL